MSLPFSPGNLFQLKVHWWCLVVNEPRPGESIGDIVRRRERGLNSIGPGDPVVFLDAEQYNSVIEVWSVLFLHPTYGVCLATDIHTNHLEKVEEP